jgi:hypothetical protein
MDVGYILLSAAASPGNQLFVSTPTDIRSINEWYWNGQQIVGATVCISGATSAYKCGGITQTDWNGPVSYSGFGTYQMYNLWKTDIVSAAGDSGGPVFSGLRAYGVHSAGSGTSTLYTPLGTVYSSTGKQVCITSGC